MRCLVACALALSGCSFTGVESAHYVTPDRIECHADVALPIVDGVVGVAALVSAGALSARARGEDPLSREIDSTGASVLGVIGALAAVSAIDGEVPALDADFHDIVFARDAAIARCLAPASAAR